MSEQVPIIERLPEGRELELPAHASPEKASNKVETGQEKAAEFSPSDIERIRDSIRNRAPENSEAKQALQAAQTPTAQRTHYIDKGMKKKALQDELKAVQANLPTIERKFSQVVHARPVKAVSVAGEKTIARPTALLWGGIFAFATSLAVYALAKYIGFHYNSFVAILGLGAGYVFGLLVELFIRLGHVTTRNS